MSRILFYGFQILNYYEFYEISVLAILSNE
jgi:hypothetical protein